MTGLAVSNTLEPLSASALRVFQAGLFSKAQVALALTFLTVLTLFVGTGLRIAAFASERSLWIDEAMLALNIRARTPEQLLAPLDHNQGAPLGFLFTCKASVTLFGMNEHSLRLPSLLASLIGLFAFASAAFQLLPGRAARLALALFALAPYLVTYSAECKQYGFDAAASCVLLALAAGLLNGRTGAWRWCLLALGGAGAVWFSHPSLFVAGGLGVALVLQAFVRKNRQQMLAAVFTGAAWLASFALVYLVNLRHLGENRYLLDYWAGYFLTWPTKPTGAFWIVEKLGQFLVYPGGFAKAVAIPAILGIAVIRKWEQGTVLLIALLGPCLLALIASAIQKYPFGGRLLLFLVPGLIMFTAVGAMELAVIIGRTSRFIAVLGIGFLLFSPAYESREILRHPMHTEDVKPVLRELQSHWQPGDHLYVYNGSGDAGAGPAFEYYAPQFALPQDRIVLGGIHRNQPEDYLQEVRALPKGRVWLLVSHEHKDEAVRLRAYFESERRPGERITRTGAAAFAYDER